MGQLGGYPLATLLPGALLLCTQALAQAEAAPPPAVGVCEFAVSNKLGSLKKELKNVDKAWSKALPEQQPGAKSISCKRNVMAKEELRLNKLVSLGQKNEVRYVVAPAAAKSKASKKAAEFSVWLVDVEQAKQVGEFTIELPAGTKDFKAAWPDALEQAADAMRSALAGEGAGGAPAPAEDAAAPPPGNASASAPTNGSAASPEGASAGSAVATTEPAAEGGAAAGEPPAAGAGTEGASDATAESPTDATPGAEAANAGDLRRGAGGANPWLMASAGALVGVGVGAGAVVAANYAFGSTLRNIEKTARLDDSARQEINDLLGGMATVYDVSAGVAVTAGVVGVVLGATALFTAEE